MRLYEIILRNGETVKVFAEDFDIDAHLPGLVTFKKGTKNIAVFSLDTINGFIDKGRI